jgi:hypothetical protein
MGDVTRVFISYRRADTSDIVDTAHIVRGFFADPNLAYITTMA